MIDLLFANNCFLLTLIWIAGQLVLLPIIGIILVVIYSYSVQYKMRELSETTFRASALRNSTLVESLTALETIKAHGAESQMAGEVGKDDSVSSEKLTLSSNCCPLRASTVRQLFSRW